MNIKLELGDAIKSLEELIDVSADMHSGTRLDFPKHSLENGRSALEGNEAAMFSSWTEVTVAKAALAVQLHSVCVKGSEGADRNQRLLATETAKNYRAMVLYTVKILSSRMSLHSEFPFVGAEIEASASTIASIESGDHFAMDTLAATLYRIHDKILASHVPAAAGGGVTATGKKLKQ